LNQQKNMSNRVLIFSLAYYPRFIGGDAVAIKEITDRIDSSDIEFHMVTLRFDSSLPKEEKIGNVTVHRIGWSKKDATPTDFKHFPLYYTKVIFQFSAVFKAILLHRKFHFNAVWAMMAHSAGVPAAVFNMLYPDIPFVLTLQEGDPPEYIEKTMRPLRFFFNRSFTRATVVQTISNFLADWARRRGFNGPLEVIPNGASVDLSKKYSESELDEYKNKIGKKEGDIFVVSVSRLVHKNGLDDIVRALPSLPQNIKLLLVGEGPDKEMLDELASNLKVSERVVFTGHVDRTETAKYRAVSDIFCRPSRSEGMGNSFASAMASRLPIIATQEGGLADFIFDAKRNPDKETTAWVVDKDSPEQIKDAILVIIAHPEQVKNVTNICYKLITEVYNWDFISKHMRERVFARVLH
jgi:glycosyltransferase involved in cell wall biosynthesis